MTDCFPLGNLPFVPKGWLIPFDLCSCFNSSFWGTLPLSCFFLLNTMKFGFRISSCTSSFGGTCLGWSMGTTWSGWLCESSLCEIAIFLTSDDVRTLLPPAIITSVRSVRISNSLFGFSWLPSLCTESLCTLLCRHLFVHSTLCANSEFVVWILWWCARSFGSCTEYHRGVSRLYGVDRSITWSSMKWVCYFATLPLAFKVIEKDPYSLSKCGFLEN